MIIDRSTILRTAHAATRGRMLPTREFNYSLTWCRERRLYVQPLRYRQVLAQEMRKAWANARPILAQPDRLLTAAEAAEVASLRYLATIEPLNRAGAIAFRAANAKADAIFAAARQRSAA
jgi:hypothetical protein